MRCSSWCVAIVVLASAGCSIHPLPQDVTQVDTYEIVSRFRCEMRSAIRRRLINAIRRRPVDAPLADQLESGTLSYAALRKKIRSPDLLSVINRYDGATILYDFSLTMSENNDTSGSATLTRPFSRGSDTLGFTLTTNNKRQNIRSFTVRDGFEKLLTYVDQAYCDEKPVGPNYDYPIAGSTKLDEFVRTYLSLNQSGNLSGPKDKADTPTMSEDLQFTTKKIGTFSPGFSYSPLGPFFELAGASGTLSASREDIHRVTIVLSLPPEDAKPSPLTLAETDRRARERLSLATTQRNENNIQQIGDVLSRRGIFR